MIQDKVEIISNKVVGEGYYRMALRGHRLVKEAMPGQFVHIRVADAPYPLLRRPISIHSLDDNETFSLLYEVVGDGTDLMSKAKPGQALDVIGPLGNGFNFGAGLKRAILVGGGIGVAPLLFAAQTALRRKLEVTVLIGARTRDCLLCVADFKNLGCGIETITDDGSSGREGYVTDLLEAAIVSQGKGPAVVMACGPRPMMRRAAVAAGLYDVPCQVSLEEAMACGVGTCLGCAVMTEDGYKRVCADGPVFSAGDVLWEP
jgi:dihydroorotate dehydrogenase electron transfer subunit